MVKIHQLKGWQNRFKNMTQIYTVYNKFTSNITSKLKVKGQETIYYAKINEKQKWPYYYRIIQTLEKENYQRQRRMLYNKNKIVNAPRRHSNSKCICIKQQSCEICEAKTDRTERRNR